MSDDAETTEDPRAEAAKLAARFRTRLARDARMGVLGLPRRQTAGKGKGKSKTTGNETATASPAPAPTAVAAVAASAESSAAAAAVVGARGLAMIREELGDCQRCRLASGRKSLVFGVGNPNAHLVFVGEAPGADEDVQGEPFVGKAGQLLTKMIEAMGYRREDVYICNVIKCLPPGNRNPEPDEVAQCEPFLKQQLGAIRPRMIVALGKFAAQCLLRDDTPITRLRGQFRTYEGIPLMPTFHPAYLLRDPSKKKEAWTDLKEVNAALRRLGIEPPHAPAG